MDRSAPRDIQFNWSYPAAGLYEFRERLAIEGRVQVLVHSGGVARELDRLHREIRRLKLTPHSDLTVLADLQHAALALTEADHQVHADSRNLIVDTGIHAILDQWLSDPFSVGRAQYGHTVIAVGTSGTAPTAADTALGTEVERNTLSAQNRVAATVRKDAYFSRDQANGSTLREAGLFGGDAASETALTGTLIARNVFADLTKTAQLALTLRWLITLTAGS